MLVSFNKYPKEGKISVYCYTVKLKSIKIRAELARPNHCAVPFLSPPPPTYTGTTIYYTCINIKTPYYKLVLDNNYFDTNSFKAEFN